MKTLNTSNSKTFYKLFDYVNEIIKMEPLYSSSSSYDIVNILRTSMSDMDHIREAHSKKDQPDLNLYIPHPGTGFDFQMYSYIFLIALEKVILRKPKHPSSSTYKMIEKAQEIIQEYRG